MKPNRDQMKIMKNQINSTFNEPVFLEEIIYEGEFINPGDFAKHILKKYFQYRPFELPEEYDNWNQFGYSLVNSNMNYTRIGKFYFSFP